MTNIFISYRRTDSQWVVDAIYTLMRQHFGTDSVFLDVDDIPPGIDFRIYLHEQVAEADVVLVVIGPDWARIMQERAKHADDFVRIEVENALKQEKLVVPVLVMDAEIPDFSELPKSIQDLQWRNLSRVRRHPDMDNDCARLARGIIKALKSLSKSPRIKSGKAKTDVIAKFLPDIRTDLIQRNDAPQVRLQGALNESELMPDTRTEPLPEGKREQLVEEALRLAKLKRENKLEGDEFLPDVETELLQSDENENIRNKLYYLQSSLEEMQVRMDWTNWTDEEKVSFETVMTDDVFSHIEELIKIMDETEDKGDRDGKAGTG